MTNTIHFPDPKFEAEVRWSLDKPTGALTRDDAADLRCLEVEGQDIADLTGIEYFAALEELECGFNKLTALDLRRNTALKKLHCCYNYDLAALEISGCTQLTELVCHDTKLAQLDLRTNTALEHIGFEGTAITTLDLSQNAALKTVCFPGLGLASLDVSGCPALTSFNGAANCLTALDLSRNPALEYLDCQINDLSALDLSGCPALKTLYCASNPLTSLDVSKNPALEIIFCVGCDIADKSAIIGLDESRTTVCFTREAYAAWHNAQYAKYLAANGLEAIELDDDDLSDDFLGDYCDVPDDDEEIR